MKQERVTGEVDSSEGRKVGCRRRGIGSFPVCGGLQISGC